MKLVFMVLMAFGFSIKMGLAAPTVGESVEAAALPQMPSGAELARCLGFPAKVHFKVTTTKTSGLFEDVKPLLVCMYSAEKQTPYSYGIEIYPAGSLYGAKRQEYEQDIEKHTNNRKNMWEKYKKEALIKNGHVLEGDDYRDSFISVETRPDGRKVFFSGYALGPGGSIIGALTKVGKYDVVFLQYAFGGDGDDPEENERMSKMANPSQSLPAAFAQLEKVIPIFPPVPETPRPTPAPLPSTVVNSVAAPAPRRLTGAEFAQCLDLLKPVKFHSHKGQRSPIFSQYKPTWVTLYESDLQFFSGYSVEVYPARTLFGKQRNWLEQWLEGRGLQERKAVELARKSPKQVKSKPISAPSSAVVIRPDGRKVYFRLFTMASGAPAPTVFSTIGDYDVVLTQFSYSTDAEELVARKKVAPRRGMLQAFAKLEALISRK